MNAEQKMLVAQAKLTVKLVLKSLISRSKYNGLKIVHDDSSMKLMGSPIAMFLRVSRFDFIVVDDAFYGLPEDTQSFILAHEYGHSIDIDLGKGGLEERNNERITASLDGKVVREEAFADDYAVKVVGREASISALKDIRNTLPFFSRNEVNCRIERLEGGK